MKRKGYASLIAKPIVLGSWVIVFSLSVVIQTQAKSPASSDIGLSRPSNAVLSISDQQASKIINAAVLKARAARLIAHNAKLNPKSLRVLSAGCGCGLAAPQEDGFGSCMKGCLADAGASAFALIICGVTCATGNVIICAVCVGLSVTIVEACALGCLAYPGPYGGGGRGAILSRNSTLRHAAPASLAVKLKLRPARKSS